MTAPKIAQLVKSCRVCPNRRGHDCEAADARITDIDVIPPFCPLADYPSQIIASQDATITSLRNPHQWGFSLALLTHVAAKLKLKMNAIYAPSVDIPYTQGGEEHQTCLMSDYIVDIELPGFAVVFVNGDQKFKLLLDTSPPLLSIESKESPGNWEQLNLRT